MTLQVLRSLSDGIELLTSSDLESSSRATLLKLINKVIMDLDVDIADSGPTEELLESLDYLSDHISSIKEDISFEDDDDDDSLDEDEPDDDVENIEDIEDDELE